MEIKSLQNDKIKQLKRAYDKKRIAGEMNIFFIEGIKLFKEYIRSGNDYRYILYSPSVLFDKNEMETLEGLDNLESEDYERIFKVPKSILNKFSRIAGDQGVLIVAERFYFDLDDLLIDNKDLIVLAGVQDPGNFGTIIRLAEGLGIGGIVVSSDTVSEFNEKTVRASMGSVLNVPVFRSRDLTETIDILKDKGYLIAATVVKNGENITKVKENKPTAFIFGNEGSGIPEKILNDVDLKISIPLKGSVDSFNVAVSVALTLCNKIYKEGEDA